MDIIQKTNDIEEIRCNKCGNLVGMKRTWAKTEGILFWCRKCKKNFEINNNSAPVAKDF